MASHAVYQFYAELDDYTPKIWRRFQVSANITVARLGYILMTLFEMKASHLFAFELPMADNFHERIQSRYPSRKMREIPDEFRASLKIYRYEIPNDESFAEQNDDYVVFDATTHKISRITKDSGTRLNFNYDFGDDWWISLTLENVFFDKELNAKELPRVLEGAGYGIIEDCGGVSGLEELTKAFKKKKGREYNEYSKWLGIGDLDMSAFDINDMDFRLKKVPRIYTDIYEHHIGPTKQSIDLLERKYLQKKANAEK